MQTIIDVTKKPTDVQLQMLEKAASMEIPADSEYPEFTEEELMQFKRISNQRRNSRQKQTLTLRLSPQSIAKAKSLGKGYTSVLSRILENALENPDIIKRYL